MMGKTWAAAVFWSAQPRRGDVGAFAQHAQLFPGDGGIDLAVTGKCAEATIRAGDDALDADDVDEAREALGDEFGMLDVVGAGVDQTRREHLVLGDLRLRPYLP